MKRAPVSLVAAALAVGVAVGAVATSRSSDRDRGDEIISSESAAATEDYGPVVFYAGLNNDGLVEADPESGWEFALTPQGNFSVWAAGNCRPDAAAGFPSDRGLHTLVGFSLGRLGPVYFLQIAPERWNEIDTIYLLDPGNFGDMAEPSDGQDPCDHRLPSDERPSAVLARWLAGGQNRRLIIVAAERSNSDGRAGIAAWYLYDIYRSTQDVADRTFICVDQDFSHDEVVEHWIRWARHERDCPIDTRERIEVIQPSTTIAPPDTQPPATDAPPSTAESATSAPPSTAPPITATAPPTVPPTAPPTTAPPATAAPPPTFAETVGGDTHTWTNFRNAGGYEGPLIPRYTTVQIRCRIEGFAVQNGNTWWYRIASSPWSDSYYASADAFYNNGQTSGSLVGTPYVDERVPNC